MIKEIDMVVTILGIFYGVTLIVVAFVRSRITESMRIDALFMPRPTENTRPLNLFAGIIIAGYSIYSLLY